MEIKDFLNQLDSIANYDASKVLEKACLKVENDAKINCPVGTGELRNSITHKVTGNEGVVYTTLKYAPYIEYGTGLFAAAGNGRKDVPWVYKDAEGEWHSTSGQKPQPYMVPALQTNLTYIENLFINDLLDEVKQNGGL